MGVNKISGSQKLRWSIVVLVIVGITLWYTGAAARLVGSGAPSEEQRKALGEKAVAVAAAQAATWPKTEPELIQAFWSAISAADMKQATLYCPGSTESDYSSYTRLKPLIDCQVGSAQSHPRAKGVTLWPVQVKFTYYGKKSIKLATRRSSAGQLIIDGQNSVWW
jgi:hypothetical protein